LEMNAMDTNLVMVESMFGSSAQNHLCKYKQR